jgi:hypothetical protein
MAHNTDLTRNFYNKHFSCGKYLTKYKEKNDAVLLVL